MGAARAEVRGALEALPRIGEAVFFLGQEVQAFLQGFIAVAAIQPGGDGAGHHGRGQFGDGRQQIVAVVVPFADDVGPFRILPAVELGLELVLDQATLFLHHQDFFQAGGKFVDTFRLQRPGHGHLVDGQADGLALLLAQPQVGQGLNHV